MAIEGAGGTAQGTYEPPPVDNTPDPVNTPTATPTANATQAPGTATEAPGTQGTQDSGSSGTSNSTNTPAPVTVDTYQPVSEDQSYFQQIALGTNGALAQGAATTPRTFTSEGPNVPSDVAPDSPEAAAQYVANLHGITGETAAIQSNVFAQQLIANADDAQWVQDFYSALGTEKAAELISQAGNSTNYNGWSAEEITRHTDAVGESLATLYDNGMLNQADMDRLMQSWTTDSDSMSFRGLVGGGNHFNAGIGQIVAGTSNDGLKNLYFNSAQSASQNADLPAEVRNDVAASGAYVLSRSSSDNQVTQLNNLREQGTLSDFVSRAMAGESQIPTLTNGARDDSLYTGEPRPEIWEANDGIARLSGTLAWADVRDGWQGAPPVNNGDLSATRQEFFLSAAKGMDTNPQSWDGNTMLKDGLSVIFRKEFDNLIFNNLAGNNASLANGTVQESFEDFFEHALFTGPEGYQRDATSEFIADRVGGWMDDVSNLFDAAFQQKYGVDKTQLSKVAGEVLAHVSNGMENAIASAKDKQAAQEAVVKSMVDFGFALLPAGGPIKGVLGASGVAVLDRVFGHIDGQIRSQLKDATTDQAKAILAENLPDFNADAVLRDFPQELNDTIPESNSRNYLSAFQSSYNTIDLTNQ